MSVKYSDLIIGDRVGAGACSAVHLATHKDTGEKYAIKWFNIFDQNHSQMLFAELNFLHQGLNINPTIYYMLHAY